jgi:hypothetical protein
VTEQVPYRVIATYPDFEVRRYAAHGRVSVDAQGGAEAAGMRGFPPLFGFISGANAASERIAMTAPVFQERPSEDVHRISFAMPSSMDQGDIPTPSDPGLTIRRVPSHDAAVVRFRGSWREDRVRRKADALLRAVAAAGLETRGGVVLARYDPPFKPPILRRNEVMVELASMTP